MGKIYLTSITPEARVILQSVPRGMRKYVVSRLLEVWDECNRDFGTLISRLKLPMNNTVPTPEKQEEPKEEPKHFTL